MYLNSLNDQFACLRQTPLAEPVRYDRNIRIECLYTKTAADWMGSVLAEMALATNYYIASNQSSWMAFNFDVYPELFVTGFGYFEILAQV